MGEEVLHQGRISQIQQDSSHGLSNTSMALPIATDLRFLLLGKGHNRLRLFEGKGEYHQYSKLAIDDTTNKKIGLGKGVTAQENLGTGPGS